MTQNDDELRRSAAAAMGRARTEKKAAAARDNKRRALEEGKDKGGRPQKAVEDFPCTCGGCPDHPKTTCPRGRAIRRRQAPQ